MPHWPRCWNLNGQPSSLFGFAAGLKHLDLRRHTPRRRGVQLGLGIEQLHLARPAVLHQHDHGVGGRGEMARPGPQIAAARRSTCRRPANLRPSRKPRAKRAQAQARGLRAARGATWSAEWGRPCDSHVPDAVQGTYKKFVGAQQHVAQVRQALLAAVVVGLAVPRVCGHVLVEQLTAPGHFAPEGPRAKRDAKCQLESGVPIAPTSCEPDRRSVCACSARTVVQHRQRLQHDGRLLALADNWSTSPADRTRSTSKGDSCAPSTYKLRRDGRRRAGLLSWITTVPSGRTLDHSGGPPSDGSSCRRPPESRRGRSRPRAA